MFLANLSQSRRLNATFAGCRQPPASYRGYEGFMTQTTATGATATGDVATHSAGHAKNKHLPVLVLGALGESSVHPRPMCGILVAITVMNCTWASSGRLAM